MPRDPGTIESSARRQHQSSFTGQPTPPLRRQARARRAHQVETSPASSTRRPVLASSGWPLRRRLLRWVRTACACSAQRTKSASNRPPAMGGNVDTGHLGWHRVRGERCSPRGHSMGGGLAPRNAETQHDSTLAGSGDRVDQGGGERSADSRAHCPALSSAEARVIPLSNSQIPARSSASCHSFSNSPTGANSSARCSRYRHTKTLRPFWRARSIIFEVPRLSPSQTAMSASALLAIASFRMGPARFPNRSHSALNRSTSIIRSDAHRSPQASAPRAPPETTADTKPLHGQRQSAARTSASEAPRLPAIISRIREAGCVAQIVPCGRAHTRLYACGVVQRSSAASAGMGQL